MHPIICDAINRQIVLEISYDGYRRMVEPHAYGYSRANNDLLRAYQIAGGSVSSENVGWKLLRLDETWLIQQTYSRFSVRPDYRPDDRAMSGIYCQI